MACSLFEELSDLFAQIRVERKLGQFGKRAGEKEGLEEELFGRGKGERGGRRMAGAETFSSIEMAHRLAALSTPLFEMEHPLVGEEAELK